jgi:hypothetical protein
MQIRALTGTGIGLPIDRRVDKARHILNKGLYAIAREGFKKMVSYNVWGLGTALLSAWWKDKALQKQWQDVWYNLGAENKDFWNLYNKAEKGYNRKKAILLKLAPKKIKAFYTKATGKKISGQRVLGETGIGFVDWVLILTTVLKLIDAISGLLGVTMNKSGKELNEGGIQELTPEEEAKILADIKKAEDEAKKKLEEEKEGGSNLGIALPMMLLVGGALFMGNKK